MDTEQMILYPQFNPIKMWEKTFDGGDEKARRNAQYFIAKMFLYIYAGRCFTLCYISPKKGKLASFFKLIFIKQRRVFLNFCLKELKQLCTNNIK